MYRIRSSLDFKEKLSPENSGMMLIDFQSELVGRNNSTAMQNALQLYLSAKKLQLPMAVTSLVGNNRPGALLSILEEHVPEADLVQRQTINAWSVDQVQRRIEGSSITKVVLAGAMVDVSLTQTCLNCLRENYDV